MNELKVFDFEQQNVRTVIVENEPYFVGKDVAEVLGYSRPDNAVRSHIEKEDKLTHQISASGQNRKMTLINESGLYSLILKSKLPDAKRFKRWVTSEVLPHPAFKHCVARFDGGSKRYIHIANGLQALDNILLRR